MLPVRLILSPDFSLRAEPTGEEPQARALAQFLNTDVAGDARHCQALLEGGAAVLAGMRGDWQISGNSYGLTLGSRTTEMRPLHTKEAAVSVATSEFLDLIAQWQGLLARGPSR